MGCANPGDFYLSSNDLRNQAIDIKMSVAQVSLPLPVLSSGWAADKDFKAVGTLSRANDRSIEPVGPHFLAHARRARHKRTFSEDDRIQAQNSVKKVEDDDAGEISEAEDPSMLLRDAKDWKVSFIDPTFVALRANNCIATRSLRRSWTFQVPLQGL